MASPRDAGLLHKCEEFLLHPTVRVLSLAQRVDFLEKKGLSPEEITQCLKSVERRNGLSQLARRTAEELAVRADENSLQLAEGASSAAASSPLKLLQFVVKKYGMVTLLLALLGVGYVQFKKRQMQRLVIKRENEKLQRTKRMSAKVEALLAVVSDQQTQYNQAAELLRARVNKYVIAKQAAEEAVTKKVDSNATQFTRGSELQALQSELMELKSAVVDTYLRPTVVEKVVQVKKELPMVLRPAEARLSDRFARGTETEASGVGAVLRTERTKIVTSPSVRVEKKARRESRKQKEEEVEEESQVVRDQTMMSSAEITKLFQSGQFDEELSTARSYRILFATQ